MRILISNPDTLGDVMLRQPLFTALAAASHELCLIVRPAIAPLARQIIPSAHQLLFPADVFAEGIENRWEEFAQLFTAAREYAPDLYVVASYQWTAFEEKLAEELPGVRRVAMNGTRFAADPMRGPRPAVRLNTDVTVEVAAASHETAKAAALASAILGRHFDLPDPVLTPTGAQLAAGRAAAGDEPYWAVCVTGTAHVPIKDWGSESWRQLLWQWHKTHGTRFVFVGLPEERPAAEQVAAEIPSAALAMDGELDTLIGVLAACDGYVGHDTGPMHLAAALGKPVLAVFGGGHWPRFTPAARIARSLCVQVPCIGCDWNCPFSRPYCVRSLSVESIWLAAEEILAGGDGRQAVGLPPSMELLAQMVREGAAAADGRLRSAVAMRQSMQQDLDDRLQLLDQRGGEIAALYQRIGTLESEITTGRELAGRLQSRVAELDGRLQRIRTDAFAWMLEPAAGPADGPISFRDDMQAGLVSVIIPAYNAAGFLEAAVRSVWSQTPGDFAQEILVCDDGSTDGTLDLARQLAAQSPIPLSILHHPDHANRGVSATRNLGLAAARGEFIALLDADDRFLPEKTATQIAYLAAHPDAGAVCAWGHNRDPQGKLVQGWTGSTLAGDYRHVLPPDDFHAPYTFEQLLKGDPIVNSTLLIHRAALRPTGGYPRLMAHQAEDWVLLAKLALGGAIHLIERPLIDYLVHPQSYTSQYMAHSFGFGSRLEFLHHLVHWMIQRPEHRALGERIFRREYPRLVAARAGAYKLIEDYCRHHNGNMDDVVNFEAHLHGVYVELEQLRLFAREREWVLGILQRVPGLKTAYGVLRGATRKRR